MAKVILEHVVVKEVYVNAEGVTSLDLDGNGDGRWLVRGSLTDMAKLVKGKSYTLGLDLVGSVFETAKVSTRTGNPYIARQQSLICTGIQVKAE